MMFIQAEVILCVDFNHHKHLEHDDPLLSSSFHSEVPKNGKRLNDEFKAKNIQPICLDNCLKKINSINWFPETLPTAVEERERSQRRSFTLLVSDSSRRTSCPAGRWHIEFGTLSLKWKHYFYRLMLRKIWKLTRVMRKRGEFWTTGWQPPPRSPPTATQSPAPLHRSFAPMMDLPMPHVEDNMEIKSLECCTGVEIFKNLPVMQKL